MSLNIPQNITNKFSKPSPVKRDTIFDKIDPSKIGEGKYMTEGKWGAKRNYGLKGQLSMIKRKGRSVTKNLSKQNLKDIYGLISDRLKKHSTGSGVHIGMRDRKNIMYAAEKLVKTKGSHFTREDKKDLRDIVNVLEQKSRDSVLKRKSFGNNIGSKIFKPNDDINYSKLAPTKSNEGKNSITTNNNLPKFNTRVPDSKIQNTKTDFNQSPPENKSSNEAIIKPRTNPAPIQEDKINNKDKELPEVQDMMID